MLIQQQSGRIMLHVQRLLNAAAAGVLREIEHGWYSATPDEWQDATLVVVPLGGGWHNTVDAVVWPRDFVLPDLPQTHPFPTTQHRSG